MIDLRLISTNWFENQLCPSIRLSRLRARYGTTTYFKKFKSSLISYIYWRGEFLLFFLDLVLASDAELDPDLELFDDSTACRELVKVT